MWVLNTWQALSPRSPFPHLQNEENISPTGRQWNLNDLSLYALGFISAASCLGHLCTLFGYPRNYKAGGQTHPTTLAHWGWMTRASERKHLQKLLCNDRKSDGLPRRPLRRLGLGIGEGQLCGVPRSSIKRPGPQAWAKSSRLFFPPGDRAESIPLLLQQIHDCISEAPVHFLSLMSEIHWQLFPIFPDLLGVLSITW